MIEVIKASLWSQFGACIDTLTQVIDLVPASDWKLNTRYFYIAYHTTVMLDYYLTIPPAHFSASLPYTIMQAREVPPGVIGDMVPRRLYTKTELLDYISHARAKCRKLINELSVENLNDRFIEEFDDPDAMDYNIIEVLL